MKKVFLKVGLWIRSLFIRKSNCLTSEVSDCKKRNSECSEELAVKENLFDLQTSTTEIKYHSFKNKTLTISTGETFELTEKQVVFYNIIKRLQELNGFASSNAILSYFLKEKYKNLSSEEFHNVVSKSHQKLSAHGKTLKGMFKSGLLERVSRNEYRVKI